MPGLKIIKSNLISNNFPVLINLFLNLTGIFFVLSSSIVQKLSLFKKLKQEIPDFPKP
jgi:hypothetical protein